MCLPCPYSHCDPQIDQNPETHRYNVGVSALVRVTLRDGAFHEDIGYGALENAKGKGMALDKVCAPSELECSGAD
jgi:recombination DNA repair RAD52 pathway protein